MPVPEITAYDAGNRCATATYRYACNRTVNVPDPTSGNTRVRNSDSNNIESEKRPTMIRVSLVPAPKFTGTFVVA